ncbi:kinetochore-associated Ndc80 complex subunit nuf2 [Paramarasmius palmivorus]|uniref:Kinetochore-associated Ndc80 complex subunit nuf2 n=1 Tax=Paramarasmius palmivorus TaxID=297713 RepID=A0AAW0D3I6_9AGAR
MAKGIYPSLSIPDIINALSGWGLSISEEQLLRPTPDFVEGVYCACLQQVTDITSESLMDSVQDSLSVSVLEEKDMYTSALSSNLLLYHLNRFATAARVEDFSAIDITHPKRDRTLILLSAFINFVRFTEQLCNDRVDALRKNSETILVEREKVGHKLTEVRRQIAEIKAKLAEDEPRCEELRQQNNAMVSQLLQTKESQKASVAEVERLKAEKKELLQRREAFTIEINSVEAEIQRIRGRIVQSPERVKRAISTMGSQVSEDKRTVAANEAKARELQAKINALSSIEQDIRSCIDQLQVIEKETRSLHASQRELTELRDQFEDKKIERNELKLRQERVEKQLSNAYQKLEQAQKRAEEKKASSQKNLERLQDEYDRMVVERRENDKQVQQLRAEADEVEAKIAEHVKTSEAELNTLLAEYWKLRHETDVYMETLANKLNMRVSTEDG